MSAEKRGITTGADKEMTLKHSGVFQLAMSGTLPRQVTTQTDPDASNEQTALREGTSALEDLYPTRRTW